MTRDRAGTVRLLAVAIAAVITVAVANWRAAAYLAPSNEANEPPLNRTDRIQFFAHDPSNLAPPLPPPQLLLIGNSHTYTLPGLNSGQGLRIGAMASHRILLDELMDRIERAHPTPLGSYYLLAYPNFLPYEMLTRVAQLYQYGYQPNLVVVGITWRNIARDSQLRTAIRNIYRKSEDARRKHDNAPQGPDFADAFLEMLKSPAVDAAPAIVNAVATDMRWARTEDERDRTKSDADKLDKRLTDSIAGRLTLLGDSAGIRARAQLDYIDPLQNAVVDRVHKAYDYDVIEGDYRFNTNCLRAMLRLLRSRGSEVICYLAPQRSDVPPLMDPAREQQFNEQFEREAATLGVAVVDARHVVPNEYWGWEYESPDRSHFT